MLYALSFGIFIPSVIAMAITLNQLRKKGKTGCGPYIVGYILVSLIPLILFFLLTAASSWNHYDGLCYGFTDGFWECSFWEYLGTELSYAAVILSPAVGLSLAAITLTFVFHWFIARRGILHESESS